MPPPVTRTASKYIFKRIVCPTPTTTTTTSAAAAAAVYSLSLRCLSTAAMESAQSRKKLERIADELISLNKIERYDYSILFRLRLGLSDSGPSLTGLDPSAATGQQDGSGSAKQTEEEKTAFDLKLEKFNAAAKIKVIKEVRGFTDLGLKEAKDLVEKAPAVIKKGVTKEEGDSIIEKMKSLGATVVLE